MAAPVVWMPNKRKYREASPTVCDGHPEALLVSELITDWLKLFWPIKIDLEIQSSFDKGAVQLCLVSKTKLDR